MQISLRSNLQALQANIKSYQRLIPAATADALNLTARQFRQEIVTNTWPQSVKVRNTRFLNAALRIEWARKANLSVTVYDHLKREYLQRLDKSGVKIPMGNHIAIAGREVKDLIRGGGGAVKKAYKPRTLLDKKRFFKTRLKAGFDAIVERPAGKEAGKRKAQRQIRGPIKIWYLLEPKGNIPKMFPFYQTAERIIKTNLEKNFRYAFKKEVLRRVVKRTENMTDLFSRSAGR
jgi:hypothetical protein